VARLELIERRGWGWAAHQLRDLIGGVVAARKKVAEAHGESPSTFAERTLSRSMARSKIVAKPLKTRAAADKPIKRGRRDFQTRRCGLHVAAVEKERGCGFLDIEGNGLGPGQPRKVREREEFVGRWSAHGGAIVIRGGPSGDGSL
jgi:hypothetical protein